MNKSLMQAIVVAAVAAPIVSVAQENVPLTRAQVKSEIAQLEKSGYSPVGSNIDYPVQLQAAETRAGNQAGNAEITAYGGAVAGASAVGARGSASARANSLYLDNANSLYVGD